MGTKNIDKWAEYSKQQRGGGTSVYTLLLAAFIVLKLTNVIDWSWWWVLSPLWIPLLIAIVIIFIVLLISD